MKRVVVALAMAGVAVTAAALLVWPHSKVNAQVSAQANAPQAAAFNAEGCSCSRPTQVGAGREQLSIYYCACPAMQCMVTATAAGTSVPPNVVQSCRTDLPQSQFIAPPR